MPWLQLLLAVWCSFALYLCLRDGEQMLALLTAGCLGINVGIAYYVTIEKWMQR